MRTNPGSFRIVRGRTKRKGIEAVLGLELPPTVSMCTALDNYNVLRYTAYSYAAALPRTLAAAAMPTQLLWTASSRR